MKCIFTFSAKITLTLLYELCTQYFDETKIKKKSMNYELLLLTANMLQQQIWTFKSNQRCTSNI